MGEVRLTNCRPLAGLMGTPHGPALMVSFCYCGVLAHGERHRRSVAEAAAANEGHRAGRRRYTAEFSMGDGPSAGGGAFLPELSDAVIDVLASSYSERSAGCERRCGTIFMEPSRACRSRPRPFRCAGGGFDLFICAPWQGAEGRRRTLGMGARPA